MRKTSVDTNYVCMYVCVYIDKVDSRILFEGRGEGEGSSKPVKIINQNT